MSEPIEVSVWESGFRKIREGLEAQVSSLTAENERLRAEVHTLMNSEDAEAVRLEAEVERLRKERDEARAELTDESRYQYGRPLGAHIVPTAREDYTHYRYVGPWRAVDTYETTREGACVSVNIRTDEELVSVTDEDDRESVFTFEEWREFIAGVKLGEFDV